MEIVDEYKQKIEELLTLPRYRKNKFLKSILEQIENDGWISTNQMIAVDKMDRE